MHVGGSGENLDENQVNKYNERDVPSSCNTSRLKEIGLMVDELTVSTSCAGFQDHVIRS